ncbi:hypothetical protein EVAR_99182_1 [Eumeta japonica]|uniref:Uncharacterized protein n=1 Tax=Eumeta variegata TaxID=151549 RepID=A0A4C1YPR5_EUMVA|nr:hypothetical protein EVAR_99182_1 [Eumeta japonica]
MRVPRRSRRPRWPVSERAPLTEPPFAFPPPSKGKRTRSMPLTNLAFTSLDLDYISRNNADLPSNDKADRRTLATPSQGAPLLWRHLPEASKELSLRYTSARTHD